jgi:hypothetical protein
MSGGRTENAVNHAASHAPRDGELLAAPVNMLLPPMLDLFYLVIRGYLRRQLLPDEPLPSRAVFTLQVLGVRLARARLVAPEQERVS